MYLVDGPVNLNRLATVCDIEDRPELLYQPFTQGVPEALVTDPDIFSVLSKKNVLLYHPYQSFAPVIDFIKTAASTAPLKAASAADRSTDRFSMPACFRCHLAFSGS